MTIVFACPGCGTNSTVTLPAGATQATCAGCHQSFAVALPLAEAVKSAAPVSDAVIDAKLIIDHRANTGSHFDAPPPIEAADWQQALKGLIVTRVCTLTMLAVVPLFCVVFVFPRLAPLVALLTHVLELMLAVAIPIGFLFCRKVPSETVARGYATAAAVLALVASACFFGWLICKSVIGIYEIAETDAPQLLPKQSTMLLHSLDILLLILGEGCFVIYLGRIGKFLRNGGIRGHRGFLFTGITLLVLAWVWLTISPQAPVHYHNAIRALLMIMPVICFMAMIAIGLLVGLQLMAMLNEAIKVINRASYASRNREDHGV